MAEEIKELIEKIQQEGIQEAENKARRIEDDAQQKAGELIEKAKQEAAKIILEAKEKSAKMDEGTRQSLKQAGRDLLLSLRKEINAMLDRIIVEQVVHALKPDELAKIISELIKNYSRDEESTVLLKKEDLEKLGKSAFSELKEKTKHGITIKPSEDISGGFVISYDSGKSQYDFTDKAIASYIGSYLKPKLNELLSGL